MYVYYFKYYLDAGQLAQFLEGRFNRFIADSTPH